MENRVIQTIIPEKCPHCSGDIFITYEVTPPQNMQVIKQSDIQEAKELLIARLDEVTFNDADEKNRIIAWVNDPETLITKSDVDDVINKAIEDQEL